MFCTAVGMEAPHDYQGFDLVAPISQGGESPRRVGISCEYRAMAVITPSWKLSYFPEEGEGRLFNRIADPTEQMDLFNTTRDSNATISTARDGLLLALLRWRAQQDALGYMQMNFIKGGGGPSAKLAANHTRALRGLDAEKRLQEDALRFEL